MIRVYKLWKQYGDAPPVLQNLSLHVDKGEFVFLTGPSGSGKSTLLRVLIGEEKPSSGQVVIGGKDVGALPASQIPYLRRTIGFVFQDFKLLPHRTALDNVSLVLKISGLSPGEQRIRAIKAIRRVGLEHRMHYVPAMLSGGEQQRVAIARAVVNDPALLLADEPTGNLDPALSLDILNIFREINARGTTVVVATHDPRLIGEVKRRVIYLTATGGPANAEDDDFLDEEIGVTARERAASREAAATGAAEAGESPARAGAASGRVRPREATHETPLRQASSRTPVDQGRPVRMPSERQDSDAGIVPDVPAPAEISSRNPTSTQPAGAGARSHRGGGDGSGEDDRS